MKSTTRDNILYMTIALSIVGIGGLIIWYDVSHGLPVRAPISTRQFAFVYIAALVFGYAIREWRKAWQSARFWTVLAILFVIYLPGQWLLIQYTHVNIIMFVLINLVELFALLFALEKLLPHEFRPRRKGSPHT